MTIFNHHKLRLKPQVNSYSAVPPTSITPTLDNILVSIRAELTVTIVVGEDVGYICSCRAIYITIIT